MLIAEWITAPIDPFHLSLSVCRINSNSNYKALACVLSLFCRYLLRDTAVLLQLLSVAVTAINHITAVSGISRPSHDSAGAAPPAGAHKPNENKPNQTRTTTNIERKFPNWKSNEIPKFFDWRRNIKHNVIFFFVSVLPNSTVQKGVHEHEQIEMSEYRNTVPGIFNLNFIHTLPPN